MNFFSHTGEVLLYIWNLRYRMYAVLILVILLPTWYGTTSTAPTTTDAGYSVTQRNWLAKRVEKIVAVAKAPQVEEELEEEEGKVTVQRDLAGEKLTTELTKFGYNSGFVATQPFVDLNLPLELGIPLGKRSVLVPESESEQYLNVQDLDSLIPCPANPERTNFLFYPEYKISTPIIHTSFDDLFEREADESPNFLLPESGSDIESPVQQKLRDGIVHIAFTPMPGEIGNSYIVGHSSNFLWVKSSYNTIFKPLERRSQAGEEFIIWDRCGRELRFRNFENVEIKEEDTVEAYRTFGNRRVVTLQTSILENGQPTKRWLARGELIVPVSQVG